MKKQTIINIALVLAALSPMLFLGINWNAIPPALSERFEFNSSFKKIQTRNDLLIATIVISATAALLYLLMRNLKR